MSRMFYLFYCKIRCLYDFLCSQLFTMVTIHASSEQDDSEEMSSDDIDDNKWQEYINRAFYSPGCESKDSLRQEVYFNVDSIKTWIVFTDWLQKCITTSNKTCPHEVLGENFNYDTYILRKCENYLTSMLSLQQLEYMLTSIELVNNITKQFFDSYKCANVSSGSYCYDKNYTRFITKTSEEFNEIYDIVNIAHKFRKNIQLNVSVVVVVLGLIMNGVFWFLLVKHHKITDETNAIVTNIALCDFIGLIVVFPLQHTIVSGIGDEDQLIRIYGFIILFLSSCRGISVLALSIQKLQMLKRDSQRTCCSRINNCSRTFLYVPYIWGSSAALTFLISMIYWIDYFDFRYQTVFVTAIVSNLFLLLLPIIVCILNIVGSSKLKQIVREAPGDPSNSNKERYISSNAITSFCAIFWFTHAPIIGIGLIVMARIQSSLNMTYVSFGIHIIFYLSAYLNPLAQYVVHRNLRELCARCLPKKKDNVQTQCLEMSF